MSKFFEWVGKMEELSLIKIISRRCVALTAALTAAATFALAMEREHSGREIPLTETALLETICEGNYCLGLLTLEHNERTKELVLEAAKRAEGPVAVFLGPGPCNDIPLEEIITTCPQFEHIVLIDGNVRVIRKIKSSIQAKFPGLAKKIVLIQKDLTGGLCKFLASHDEEFSVALEQDIADTEKRGLHLSFSHENLIKLLESQRFSFDLKDLKALGENPSFMASSITTSQIHFAHSKFLKKMIPTEGQVNKSSFEQQFLESFLIAASHVIGCYLRNAYLNGILQSGAQIIYYSDDVVKIKKTPPWAAIDRQFFKQMKKRYVVLSRPNAWRYGRLQASVSIAIFYQKNLEETGNFKALEGILYPDMMNHEFQSPRLRPRPRTL